MQMRSRQNQVRSQTTQELNYDPILSSSHSRRRGVTARDQSQCHRPRAQAHYDRFCEISHTLIQTSGPFVGAARGQMGNSEVGHLNMAPGRSHGYHAHYNMIATGDFFSLPCCSRPGNMPARVADDCISSDWCPRRSALAAGTSACLAELAMQTD